MIVIRSDKEENGRDKSGRDKSDKSGRDKLGKSILLLLPIIAVFILLFFVIPIGIVYLFQLSWSLSSIFPYGILPGVILIITGVWIISRGIKVLRLSHGFAGINQGDTLVTTGIFAYTRNPMYFGAILMMLGLFLVSAFTFILISTVLFLLVFFIVAKLEEKQLEQKYGKKYRAYKRKVPLFFPYKGKNKKVKIRLFSLLCKSFI
jgi:protein-S-isoprenylcysteine O-methyltransferase Ste14